MGKGGWLGEFLGWFQCREGVEWNGMESTVVAVGRQGGCRGAEGSGD